MLDGGGGGYGGTNWSGVSMIDMWLAMSNQQTDNHWTLLGGWRKSYELTLQHMTAVRNYRDNLATAWPPEKSPAAAAYVERLDSLIDHLQQTYDAAVANHSAFSSATLALSSARRDLETVVNEYFANEGKLATYEQELAERSNPGKGTSSGKPPVPDGRQAQLEARARSIMYGLSGELTTAKTQLRQPKPYDGTYAVEGGGRDENGAGYMPPAIPPITPFTPGAGASENPGPAHSQTRGGSPLAASFTPARIPGLILGGIEPPAAAPPPTHPAPPPVAGHPPSAFPPPPVSAPSLPLGPGPSVLQPITGIGRPPNGGAPIVGPRAMPPGGVIGTNPGVGSGQPGPGGRPTQTINPIGGLISGANGIPSRTNSATHVGSASGTPLGPISRAAERRESLTNATYWDPDNPWETAEGVTPVVVPSEEQQIDPGPAIGLG